MKNKIKAINLFWCLALIGLISVGCLLTHFDHTMQRVVAAEAENTRILTPGDEIDIGPTNPDVSNFREKDGYVSQSGTGVARLSGEEWVFIIPKTNLGTGSYALRYPLDLTKPFDLEFSSISQVKAGFLGSFFSSDFIGAVLSTANPESLAEAQLTTRESAGFGNSSVAWQLAVGSSPYPGWLSTEPKHKIALTTMGKKLTKQNIPLYTEESGVTNVLLSKYRIVYDPDTRILIVTDKSKSGKTISTPIEMPTQLDAINVGLMGIINGNIQQDTSSVKVTNFTGTYRRVKTIIKYKDSRGNDLAPETTVNSVKGLDLSVSGDAAYNLEAPSFKSYELRDEDRTISTGKNGIDQTITVTYDYIHQNVPIKIIDDDEKQKIVEENEMAVTPFEKYNLTKDNVTKYIPENYSVNSIVNGEGVVEVNTTGDVKVIPVEIHVKHNVVQLKKEYQRIINYIPEKGVLILPEIPPRVTQKIVKIVEKDVVTNAEKILPDGGNFPEVVVPKISGYLADKLKIERHTVLPDDPEKKIIDVKYDYLTRLIVPDDINFGCVKIGSPTYYGFRKLAPTALSGELSVENGNPAMSNWQITAKLESNIKSTIFTINDKDVSVDGETIVYKRSQTSPGKEVIVNRSNQNSVLMQLFNSDGNTGLDGENQTYTIAWCLRSVPA